MGLILDKIDPLVTELQAPDSQSWHRALCNAFSPTEFKPADDAEFRGELAQARLDSARMSRLLSSAGQFLRRPNAIRRDSVDGFMILLCLTGELWLEQKDTTLRAAAGEALIYRQGTPFALEAPAQYTAVALWVTPEIMAAHCPHLANAAPLVLGRGSVNGRLALIMVQELCEAALVGEVESPLRLVEAALDVVSTNIAGAGLAEAAGRSERLMQKLADHLTRSIDDTDLDLGRLVDVSGVSPRTLNRVFGEVGTTPMRWVRDQRLMRAHEALQNGRVRNVTEAAFSFGFKDSAHFSRAFSQKYGVTPGTVLRRG